MNPRQGTLGMIGLPYLLLFQIIFPLMGPLFDLGMIVGLLSHQYQLVLGSFFIYSSADVLVSGVALRLEPESLWSLWLLIPQRLLYRQLMYYVIARSFVNVLKGNLVGWKAMKREGQHLALEGKAQASAKVGVENI